MSLILKGIDLPKKGFIKLEIHSDGLVWEEGRDWSKYENAAIQIPKGHGDIKDIDQITKSLPKMYLGGISHMVIEDAPTILGAEGE